MHSWRHLTRVSRNQDSQILKLYRNSECKQKTNRGRPGRATTHKDSKTHSQEAQRSGEFTKDTGTHWPLFCNTSAFQYKRLQRKVFGLAGLCWPFMVQRLCESISYLVRMLM